MVEILVAISLFALLATAAVPLLVTALRASVVAKLDSGAKNISQQRFELMRNLPFRIAYDPLVSSSQDVLDIYYPNLTAASGAVTSEGLVTTQPRRSVEPATGPFYRKKFVTTLAGVDYTQWVSTQFLVPDTKAPIAPTSPYDAFSLNDLAPSTLLGVTVLTEWRAGTLSKQYSVYTELSDAPAAAQMLTIQGRVSALKVTSTVGASGDADLMMETGVVNLDGAISSGTTAAVSVNGGYASVTPGTQVHGAQLVAQAPPDAGVLAPVTDSSSHDLYYGSDLIARVPKTDAVNVLAKTAGSLPVVGSSGSPVSASTYGNNDLFFTNRPNLTDSALGIQSDTPVVKQPANGGTVQSMASAYASSAGGASHSGSVNLTAKTSVINILPTEFTKTYGAALMQVQLISSSLACSSTGTTVTSTPAYSAQVRYFKYTPSDPLNPLGGGTVGYSSWITLSSSQVSDPLASAVNLTVGPGGTMVGLNNGRVVYLGEYVQSLSSQTASSLAATKTMTQSGRGSETRIPSMVNLSTVPLRSGENLSSVKVQLGVMACTAEDNR